MKRWQLIAAGALMYLLLLIVLAPATVVDGVLERASEGMLRIADARGTLWSGAGRLQILDATRQGGITKNIVWQLQPASLLRGHVACDIELDSPAKRFTVTILRARVELADADINVPATILGIASPQLASFGLGGDLIVHVADLTIGNGGVQGNGTVMWRAASSALTRVSPLGNYELRFAQSGAAMTALLRTLDGPLQLDGSGSWAPGVKPAFNAIARVSPQHRQQLEPLLRMISVERGAGNYEFKLQ